MHKNRFYRFRSKSDGLVSFEVVVKETDLFISAQSDLSEDAKKIVIEARRNIEEYIKKRPDFKTSLSPLAYDEKALGIVKEMLRASSLARVGPMASVAGAVAEAVARGLAAKARDIIVENGGDIFIISQATRKIGIFAGDSPLSNKIGIEIKAQDTPCGICTSSATVGPSLSFGKADAAVIYSKNCALADAAATAVGNTVKARKDIEKGLKLAKSIKGVKGALIVAGNAFGAWGRIKVVDIT
ncbi:MAG: UPF0280 family protein [Candidatus Omnitrophica bacterium]|nr:UPF0280 family protein [Candidatus Omnitrophota bacterium]